MPGDIGRFAPRPPSPASRGLARAVTRRGLLVAFTNAGLAALYGAFAAAHVSAFLDRPRASVLLMVAVESLFAVFFVLRREASATSTSAVAWASTLLGTFLPLLMRPVDGADLPAAQAVQAVGVALSVAGVLSLNRSVGLLPANRGVRCTGAYRLVRHPLYASYVVAHLGYVGSNPSAWNVAVALASLAAQLVRIQGEERLLSQDPEYAAYMARTRWRLLPFVY